MSGADIEELNKLTALLEDGHITLFVPRQLCEEFKRNRDSKIKDAMNEFQKAMVFERKKQQFVRPDFRGF
ncbi:hypothetical protein NJB93_04160 [Brucella intermedia]|nr:hypothetical protein [Brucella intermedia]